MLVMLELQNVIKRKNLDACWAVDDSPVNENRPSLSVIKTKWLSVALRKMLLWGNFCLILSLFSCSSSF